MGGSWKIKCTVDNAKAMLPFPRTLRRLKDRVFGYHREPAKDRGTIRDGLRLIEWLGDVSGATILEVGTGWQPMIPILLSLRGAKVYLTDLYPLMRPDTFRAALEAVRENESEIAERLGVAPEVIRHATRECTDMGDRLRELGLTYLAPCDCRHLPLEAGAVDVVMSRAVLEHIPWPVIADIFREANRVLRPDGVMLHLIDHSDHWSHRDRSITAVNFLKYPDWAFWFTCINPQNYQNRLRHSEYVSMLQDLGFVVIRQHVNVDPTSESALATMRIAERFKRFAADELATTHSTLMARR